MGMLGDYLDGLTDEQRDRVIRAMEWRPRAILYQDGARCLVGHVQDAQPHPRTLWEPHDDYSILTFFDISQPHDEPLEVGMMFDKLCERFGTERVVRAVKKRAAQGMTTEALESENPKLTEVLT